MHSYKHPINHNAKDVFIMMPRTFSTNLPEFTAKDVSNYFVFKVLVSQTAILHVMIKKAEYWTTTANNILGREK